VIIPTGAWYALGQCYIALLGVEKVRVLACSLTPTLNFAVFTLRHISVNKVPTGRAVVAKKITEYTQYKIYEPKSRYVYAVGLPVCTSVRLPSLACTHAPVRPSS